MCTAIEVAHYVISKCTKDEMPISNLQLQKILYYLQKIFLQSDRELFTDDFVAWQFGPVIEDVYFDYCSFGAMPIRRTYFVNLEVNTRMIDPIIEEKRLLNPWEMVAETHKENGAWDLTYLNGRGNGKIISKELIKAKG